MSATPASLILRGRTVPDLPFEQVQADVFFSRGVIVPLIRYECDETLEPGRAELQIDGRALVLDALDQASLKQTLEAHAAEFVIPPLVDHYMEELSDIFPDLVRATRAEVTTDDLTSLLRHEVKSGATIRDLRSVLERILQTRVRVET